MSGRPKHRVFGMQDPKLEFPPELLEGVEDEQIRRDRLGRFVTMQELRLGFTDELTLEIARGEHTGTFMGAIIKGYNHTYNSMAGISRGDIELQAELNGTLDDIQWERNNYH